MFTEQILKSILSLKTFSAAKSAHTPALEGIHISVNAETKTITALSTDRFAAARMVITVPEVAGTSWERNVSIATLNAALATVKASGGSVSVFPEAHMPEFPTKVSGLIDKAVNSVDFTDGADFNAKHLGAISKVNVGGDKYGRWTIRTARMAKHNDPQEVHAKNKTLVATATYGDYEVAVVVMPLLTRN